MVPTNRYDRGVEVSGVTSNRAAVALPNSRAGSRALRLLRCKACVLLLLLIAVFSSCKPPGGGGASGDGGTPTPPVPKAWHVSTFAGGGARGASGGDGIGTAASFGLPFSIAQSGDTLYVIDLSMHSIRSVNTTTERVGTIVTGGSRGYRNGAGTSALFDSPRGAAATAGGVLYVADTGGHRIREVRTGSSAADARVSDLAGKGASGHFDGAGADAQFSSPMGLALRDGTTLYVADEKNHRIRAIDLASPNKTVSTIAGDGTRGNTNGIGTAARFRNPYGIAVSGSTLYVASGALIRKLEYREVGS